MKTALGTWFAMMAVAGCAWAQDPVATPVISPAGPGPFYAGVEVTIQTETPGATIYYTLDGSEPDAGSDEYDGPLSLGEGTHLVRALATAGGMPDSAVASREYTVLPPRVAEPFFDPGYRFFYGEVIVSIYSDTPDATIYYTLDGQTPTRDSPVFDDDNPIRLQDDTVVKTIAVLDGLSDSEMAVKFYKELDIPLLGNNTTLSALSDPPGETKYFRMAVPSGARTLSIAITGGTGDCDLLVAFGRPPSLQDYDYFPVTGGNDESVVVDDPAEGEWFILLLADVEGYEGVQLRASYTGTASGIAEPVIFPGGRFKPGATIIAMTQSQGHDIRYTLDGTEPTASSTLYTQPFKVRPTRGKIIVKARAFAENGLESDTVTHIYKMARRIRIGKSRRLSEAPGGSLYYAVVVPDGVNRLIIGTTGGTGDCDLYVRANRYPFLNAFDFESSTPSNQEQVVIANPPAGSVYFIRLHAFGGFANMRFYVDAD